MAYWREHLAGTVPDRPVLLPFCPDQGAPLSGRVERRTATLDAHEARRLKSGLAKHRMTEYLYFLAAVLAGLARLSGESDLTVRLPIHGRSEGFEATVGWIANLVHFRLTGADAPQFADVVGRVRRTWVEQLPHQSAPYDAVRECLGSPRSPASRPAVVTVTAHTIPAPFEALGARLIPCAPDADPGLGDEAGLHLSLINDQGSYTVRCRYDPVRHPASAIDLVLDGVRVLLTS